LRRARYKWEYILVAVWKGRDHMIELGVGGRIILK
jgi:hypothetical protein